MDDPTVGVYVHVPFCERVCPYCDFAVVATGRRKLAGEERYVDALLRELERRHPAFARRRLASLDLGGGTPSLLEPGSIARIIEAVRGAFAADAPIEITLEVNPSTLERSRLAGFREAGVGRASIGVQSFDDATLKRLGRAHRADDARRTLSACRAAGFEAISLDLIFGAPGQSVDAFERDLAELLAFGPEHVSTYELTLEPGTPFEAAAARGRLALPDEEAVLAMMDRAEVRLGAAGYRRYELSNYAREGFEAVHNRRYWERRPVLGLGVGAFSTDPPSSAAPFGVRRANARGLQTYLERAAAGFPAEAGEAEVLDARTARGEAAFLGLRCARGLDAERFAREFGEPPRAFWSGPIEELVAAGLLEEQRSGDLRLSPRGRRLSDSVFQHFV